jgi:cobalt/nickel transport system permease protein
MHISEGILSAPVLLAGAALTAAGTAMGLRRLDAEKMPLVGVMAAAFFVASGATRVPIGFSSAHLLLNGLAGLLLGWAVFPALLVALFLQALLLQFGGLTTLGVNTFTMALPGLVAYLLIGGLMRRRPARTAVWAFTAGAGAVLLSAVLYAVALFSSGRAFGTTAVATLVAHLPIMPVEGLICALCVGFLRKVKPVMLPQACRMEVSDEA